ncbi:hypothetical protein SISSUDRAFT_41621 [Sistotremastrum suecicum HHB10207 ss-3]|uniref:Uncharacterized protein n=1 Tax=Sistotremastrum suecicum HHB10207 ss-3 TaxID=1314776 RepID=A0A166H7N6_9AGAM|nr:hypothetical protein SISSUDRAFT_41621 [Sistotremastrum suecicum HHB10207 ss-3]
MTAETTTEPVILSFPTILQNSKLTSRFAHLSLNQDEDQAAKRARRTPNRAGGRVGNEGKRWSRIRDNNAFTSNPHVVQPQARDHRIEYSYPRTTFPAPLPPYLKRSSSAPSPPLPSNDSHSSMAGQFSVSLKGMRRDLRRHGGRASRLVQEIEEHLLRWLDSIYIDLNPENTTAERYEFPGLAIDEQASISEVSRSPTKLVWYIEQDAFARYVVHCCCRYHNIVSFSKVEDHSDKRLTHLLRPNQTRFAVQKSLAQVYTPPVSDIDYASSVAPDTESLYDSDIHSDLGDSLVLEHPTTTNSLPVLAEESLPSRFSDMHITHPPDEPTLSSDAEGEFETDDAASAMSESWFQLQPSSSIIVEDAEDRTPCRMDSLAVRLAHRTPSISPRRPFPKQQPRTVPQLPIHSGSAQSFWSYLFA